LSIAYRALDLSGPCRHDFKPFCPALESWPPNSTSWITPTR